MALLVDGTYSEIKRDLQNRVEAESPGLDPIHNREDYLVAMIDEAAFQISEHKFAFETYDSAIWELEAKLKDAQSELDQWKSIRERTTDLLINYNDGKETYRERLEKAVVEIKILKSDNEKADKRSGELQEELEEWTDQWLATDDALKEAKRVAEARRKEVVHWASKHRAICNKYDKLETKVETLKDHDQSGDRVIDQLATIIARLGIEKSTFQTQTIHDTVPVWVHQRTRKRLATALAKNAMQRELSQTQTILQEKLIATLNNTIKEQTDVIERMRIEEVAIQVEHQKIRELKNEVSALKSIRNWYDKQRRSYRDLYKDAQQQAEHWQKESQSRMDALNKLQSYIDGRDHLICGVDQCNYDTLVAEKDRWIERCEECVVKIKRLEKQIDINDAEGKEFVKQSDYDNLMTEKNNWLLRTDEWRDKYDRLNERYANLQRERNRLQADINDAEANSGT